MDSAAPLRNRLVRLRRRLNFFRRLSRPRQFFSWLVTGIGALVLGSLVVLEIALYLDDREISSHLARATATVLTVGRLRTGIEFVDQTGATVRPPDGVMYPGLLSVGQRFLVEYSAANPDLVRVAGRTAAVGNIIIGLTALITLLFGAALLLLIRRLAPVHGRFVTWLAAGWDRTRRFLQDPDSSVRTSSVTDGAETRNPDIGNGPLLGSGPSSVRVSPDSRASASAPATSHEA